MSETKRPNIRDCDSIMEYDIELEIYCDHLESDVKKLPQLLESLKEKQKIKCGKGNGMQPIDYDVECVAKTIKLLETNPKEK